MAKKKNPKAKAVKHDPFINTVEALFSSNPFKSFNFRQVAKMLGVTDKVSREMVKTLLEKLAAGNVILELNRGKYKYNPELLADKLLHTSVTGIVDMKQTGKAYVSTPDLDEDVFISANNTGHALHGDKVKVHLFPMRKGRKTEDRLLK